MNDHFSIIPIDRLLKLILSQLDSNGPVLGLSPKLFFHSKDKESIQSQLYGQKLDSPVGVAAGPHTQLSQNIVAAWLCGARFIELKTVQTLDELSISKPCIDMQDEGYNCEWSQELKIRESFDQYLNAWTIIHILNHKLFGKKKGDPGVIFNMSVGYDYQGIQKDNVQWYLDHMKDASREMDKKIQQLKTLYPEVEKLEINAQISDNITLSTMHGCPPDEIESIASYLIEERGLHTNIKLNPTLLGPEKLHEIMLSSGFKTVIPPEAFEHDLKYGEARGMITRLLGKAEKKNLQFGLKLTNTLESKNHKDVFGDEEMMYMSGRALHPIAVNLAARLQNDFDGKLNLSFSGGANANNIRELWLSGLAPVTVCSDLLKPGGYGRLAQYIENLRAVKHFEHDKEEQKYLQIYAQKTLEHKAYKRSQIADPDLKTDRPLDYFDCIQAPCVSTCPTHQDIPDYLHFAAEGEWDKAYQVIRDTNPFPLTTGMICDHLCQTKCVRIHYDSPLLIREVKRFVAEQGRDLPNKTLQKEKTKRAAIIGAGPSGLSCAYFLAKGGMEVDIFEEKKDPGGMISHAIPAFRLSEEALQMDIDGIREMGVNIHYHQRIDKEAFEKLKEEFDYVYIGAGAQKSTHLNLENMEAKGILDPLDFLFDVKAGSRPDLGKHIVIIGGGNTAMDAARTVWRLVDKEASISIVYRRTLEQMPADQGEIQAVLDEGIQIKELLNPIEIISEKGQIKALKCQKMILGEKDKSGRPKALPLPNEFMEIPVDTLIPAIGQKRDFDFNQPFHTLKKGSYQSNVKGVFLGGDALRGASTAINAIGDGRKAAAEILEEAGKVQLKEQLPQRRSGQPEELMVKKARREEGIHHKVETDHLRTFDVLSKSLSREEVRKEASRCLKCDELCNLCLSVCPNLAFHSFRVEAKRYQVQKVEKQNDSIRIDHLHDFEIHQEPQILHLADWCNLCGNCTTFCPSSGSPYQDKAHLYLDKAAFQQEKDGFHLDTTQGRKIMYGYRKKELFSLEEFPNDFLYKCPEAQLTLEKEDLSILQIQQLKNKGYADTEMAITLSLILRGSSDFFKIQET